MYFLNQFKDKPKWLNDVSYLTIMGSRAYGTENENSDWDFYGFCVPPLGILFPHTLGYIPGFGQQPEKFEQFQAQHVPMLESLPLPTLQASDYDLTIYSIVKYFQLVADGNPNMVDSLFVSDDCILHKDDVGSLVRENRHLFLSQKMYHTFKGMLWSHLSRIKSGHVKEGRFKLAEKYGYDVKDAYHTARMLFEVKQILFTGNLDLRKQSDYLIEIRNGIYDKNTFINIMENKLKDLESREKEFIVPYSPDMKKLKYLLEACIEKYSAGFKRKTSYGVYDNDTYRKYFMMEDK